MLTGAKNPEIAIQELFDRGIKTIVHKQGADESRYIARGSDFHPPAFAVSEIVPTGAGGFWCRFYNALAGKSGPNRLFKIATAANALAVQQGGPMEGTTSYAEIQLFVVANSL